MRRAIVEAMTRCGEPMATFRVAMWLTRGNPRVIASTRRVRAELGRMAVAGVVRRNSRYTTDNNIVWELTPTGADHDGR